MSGANQALAIYMNDAGKSVVHRTGFSWVAAILLPVWALQHRLYKTCVATIVINLLSPYAEAFMAPRFRIGLDLFVILGAGIIANTYHRIVLERSGFFMASAEPHRLKGG
jgi:hypothetical protein